MTISRDDWLKAIEATSALPPSDPDAITIKEFAEMIGRSRCNAEDRMRKLVEQGKAERVTKYVRRVDGSGYPSPAYRLIRAVPTANTGKTPSKRRR